MRHRNGLLPYPVAARRLLWVSLLGFAALTAWASWARLDQITRAPAQVIASARTQSVQAAEGGILRTLAVKEGDAVRKGQVLAVLEQARAQASVNDSLAKVAALRITLARLRAEATGQDFQPSPDLLGYREYVQNQQALYAQRRRALEGELEALGRSLKLADQELGMNLPLLKTGDVSQADILRLQRQCSDIEAQISNRSHKYNQDVQAEMTKAQEELRTQEALLSDRDQVLNNTELKAPADGLVKNIRITTLGAVLRPTEELLQILPTGSELIMEAKLKPAEVAFVRVGHPVTIKLDAYDYSVFGVLKGRISYISPDTLTEDSRQGEQIYYRVQAKITERGFKGDSATAIEVRPGLTATAEIHTGRRTVLSYLVNPVAKTFHEGLRER